MRTLLYSFTVCALPFGLLAGLALPDSAAAEELDLRQVSFSQQAKPALSDAIAPFRWGQSPQAVMDELEQRLRDSHPQSLSLDEDPRLTRAVARLRSSFVRFEGGTNGWDASYLADEFVRDNQESMLVFRQLSEERYFFFHRGQLWKVMTRLDTDDASPAAQKRLATALKRRFGNYRWKGGKLAPSAEARRWIEFRDARTRLRLERRVDLSAKMLLTLENRRALTHVAAARERLTPPAPYRPATQAHLDLAFHSTQAAPDPAVVDRVIGSTRR